MQKCPKLGRAGFIRAPIGQGIPKTKLDKRVPLEYGWIRKTGAAIAALPLRWVRYEPISQMLNQSKVRILNNNGSTSHKRAERYVRRGQARWENNGAAIRFFTEDRRHQATVADEITTAIRALIGAAAASKQSRAGGNKQSFQQPLPTGRPWALRGVMGSK